MKNIHEFTRFSTLENREKRLVFAAGQPEKPQEAVPMPEKPDQRNPMDMLNDSKDKGAKATATAIESLNQIRHGKDAKEAVDSNQQTLDDIVKSFNDRFDLTSDAIVSTLKLSINTVISANTEFASWLKNLRQTPPVVTIHQKKYTVRWDPSGNGGKGSASVYSN